MINDNEEWRERQKADSAKIIIEALFWVLWTFILGLFVGLAGLIIHYLI